MLNGTHDVRESQVQGSLREITGDIFLNLFAISIVWFPFEAKMNGVVITSNKRTKRGDVDFKNIFVHTVSRLYSSPI